MNKNVFFSILHSINQVSLLAVLVFIIQTSRSYADTTIYLGDTFQNADKEKTTSLIKDTTQQIEHKQTANNISSSEETIRKRLKILDDSSPIDFSYNKSTKYYINRYLEKDVKLISRMLGISSYYFPMIEQQLDRFQIPLELKYLSIVESALNPKARSRSGAVGLWQFMYPTGKEYGLEVTSYIDERQDPLKSTIAACNYFEFLYSVFGDWHLVLAAYNGGPGYIKRSMEKTELSNYWDLRPHLKKETQGYVPKFIAISYAMTFYKEHDIEVVSSGMDTTKIDTISFKKQIPYYLLSEMFCVTKETINYLNPAYKKEILPLGNVVFLPNDVIMDVVRNEGFFYEYIEKVYKKEILVNEKRLIYVVEKGDYLGLIGKKYNVSVADIKQWNNLTSDNLSIADKLILYIPDER